MHSGDNSESLGLKYILGSMPGEKGKIRERYHLVIALQNLQLNEEGLIISKFLLHNIRFSMKINEAFSFRKLIYLYKQCNYSNQSNQTERIHFKTKNKVFMTEIYLSKNSDKSFILQVGNLYSLFKCFQFWKQLVQKGG